MNSVWAELHRTTLHGLLDTKGITLILLQSQIFNSSHSFNRGLQSYYLLILLFFTLLGNHSEH